MQSEYIERQENIRKKHRPIGVLWEAGLVIRKGYTGSLHRKSGVPHINLFLDLDLRYFAF